MKRSMIFCVTLTLISGCQPALINMPDCPEFVDNECPVIKECAYIPLPDKLPPTIHLSVEPGKDTKADQGGKKLLLNYRYMLESIKKQNE